MRGVSDVRCSSSGRSHLDRILEEAVAAHIIIIKDEHGAATCYAKPGRAASHEP
jgi:hypothetical protein